MLKKISFNALICLSLGLTAYSEHIINYSGSTFDTQYSETLGNTASTTGASASVGLEYIFPDGIALGVFVDGDIQTEKGAPILSGRYNSGVKRRTKSHFSITNKEDVLNDLIKKGNEDDETSNTETINVNGVVYSSTGTGLLTIEPVEQGGIDDIPNNALSVRFNNQTNTGSIDIVFKGIFEGQSLGNMIGNYSALTNEGNLAMDSDNRGNFSLTGDVIEGTFEPADDIGVYAGELKITLTSL